MDVAYLAYEVDSASAVKATGDLDRMGDQAATTERQVRQSAEGSSVAMRRAARSASELGTTAQINAMHVGNLTAQFNDIGVMLAAGQNPVQLALQQGTQITQVFGPMGAGQAVRSLGAALMSMVSPLNLITIGSIAAGAALFQWLTSAGEDAVEFDDRLESLSKRLESYKDYAENARKPTQELREEFGEGADEARRFYDELAQIEKSRLLNGGVSNLISGLIPEFGGTSVTQRTDIRDRFGLRDGPRDRRLVAGQMQLEQELRIADTLEEQAAAIENLLNNSRLLAEERGGVTAIEEEYLQQLAQVGIEFRKIHQITDPAVEAARERAEEERRSVEFLTDYVGKSIARGEQDQAALSAAVQLRSEWRQQAHLQETIAQYGEESRQVAELRHAQEARIASEMIESLNVSEDMKQSLRDAYDAAHDLGSAAAAVDFSWAQEQAAQLASQIERAVTATMNLNTQGQSALRQSQIRLEYRDDPVGAAGALARERLPDVSGLDPMLRTAMLAEQEEYVRAAEEAARNNQRLLEWQQSQRSSGGGGRRSGGGRTAISDEQREGEREAERVLRDIEQATLDAMTAVERYNREVADMTELHEMGFLSADDLRRGVEMLGEQLETEQMEAAENQLRSMSDAMAGLVTSGEDLGDALNSLWIRIRNNLISSGIQQAMMAAFGPMIGQQQRGGGAGGIWGQIVGSAVGAFTGSLGQPGQQGGISMPINIQNQNGSQVTAQRNPAGGLDIKVVDRMVSSSIARGAADRSIGQRFGSRPVPQGK